MKTAIVRAASLSALVFGFAACTDAAGGNRTGIRSVAVFGDSLNDVGTYQVTTGNRSNPGKFTVNPDPIWVDNIATHYGLALTPNRALTMDKVASSGAIDAVGTATVLGGNGYAEGGARVSRLPSQSGIGNNRLVAPVNQQVDRYLTTNGAFPADQLVLVDGGTNDVYAQFSAMCWATDDNNIGAGNTTLAIADAEITRAANDLVGVIRTIKANGAGVVLVAGALDWTSAPFGREYLTDDYIRTGCGMPVAASQVTEWTTQFNRIVASGVSGLADVVFLDFSRSVDDAIDNPDRYGLLNLTDAACNNTRPTTSAVFCTRATIVAPDVGQTYLWSDTFHPSPRLHQIISDQALALLEPLATR